MTAAWIVFILACLFGICGLIAHDRVKYRGAARLYLVWALLLVAAFFLK
jgi:hypothetical protein